MLRGQYNQLYYFPKNFDGHYDENGKSVKALMKTPINGARLSHLLE